MLSRAQLWVAIPGFQHRLVCVGWHHAGLVERGHGVVSLPGAVLVQGHKVDHPPWGVLLLCYTNHFVNPRGGRATGDLLYDSDGHVMVH